MPGYNHYPDCTCGWCWSQGSTSYSNAPSVTPAYLPWMGLGSTFASYTVPNALCPECGAEVFFYQSPYGGRVFFDELGPPWPKHPCTDNSYKLVTRILPSQVKHRPAQKWQSLGWEPVIIEDVERVNDWARLRLRRVSPDATGFIVRATPWRDDIASGMPAHIGRLDADGIGRFSVLHLNETGEHIVEAMLTHRVFVSCDSQILRKARKGDFTAIKRIAVATYKDWEIEGTVPGSVRYPKFVDFRIAKRWLEKAAKLGSTKAKTILRSHPGFFDLR